jgi:hypothetical protein
MRKLRYLFLLVLLLLTVLSIYAVQIEPQWLEVKPITVTLPRLSPAFDGFKLLQLSDLHWASLSDRARRQIETQTQRQHPDLIVITGDFISQGDEVEAFRADLTAFLSRLHPIAPVVAVLGNHDYWNQPLLLHHALTQSGIELLVNQVYTEGRHGAALHFAGIDDVWVGQGNLERVLKRLPQDGCAIALVHEPDFADTTAATGRFDLELSGHSHGGQVRLGRAIALPPYGKKYPAGAYQVGQMIHYTNRGLGTVIYPLRFGCRPELTVFTLRAPVT